MTIDPSTRFVDLAERETKANNDLVNTVARLKTVKRKRALSNAEQAELKLAQDIIDELRRSSHDGRRVDEVCDPLFVATRKLLNEQRLIRPALRTHDNGVLVFDPHLSAAAQTAAQARAQAQASLPGQPGQPAGQPAPQVAAKPPATLGSAITLSTLTLGLLIADAAPAPPLKAPVPAKPGGNALKPDKNHPRWGTFTREFFRAVGEANSLRPLADRVLALLGLEGDPDGRGGIDPTVRCEEFAKVMRLLFDAKVDVDEPQLRRRLNEALDRVQNVGSEDNVADLGIDLPDLEDIADQNIVADNVRAMGPMIVSAMFEELKVFSVVDRIVEQFQHGLLPIGPGEAGKMLYQYWREAPNRISEQERRNFASITLGIPGGDPGGMVNRDFNDLWIRFVSSVSSFVRQSEVDSLLRSALPSPISQQQVRKAARDLASNLSLHGYGMAHYAARETQAQVKFLIRLLENPEIRGCYGAKDMWQVVDQVATYDLGGARSSSRYRTLATCGTIITAWLADNVGRINRSSDITGPLIRIDEVRNPPVVPNHKATKHPNDYDLVNACELWLADTATSESDIERMAQEPRDTPTMTSKPIPIPAMAREMLEGLGDMGVGFGHGYAPAGSAYGASNGHGRSQ